MSTFTTSETLKQTPAMTAKIEMKNQEIIHNGKTIIAGTNGFFTAYPSNYSAYTAKNFKTLGGAKKYLDSFGK